MAAVPQSALAVRKVRCNNERAVSMSVRGEKGKSEEKKENTFNSWLPLGNNSRTVSRRAPLPLYINLIFIIGEKYTLSRAYLRFD